MSNARFPFCEEEWTGHLMSNTRFPRFTVFEIIKQIWRCAYVSRLREYVIMLLATEQAAADFLIIPFLSLEKENNVLGALKSNFFTVFLLRRNNFESVLNKLCKY
jgi:hypothetical protein